MRSNLRSLEALRANASAARVLNLALVHEQFGETEPYKSEPLFRSERLNRAIIVKHALRRDELELFVNRRCVATKVIFPLSQTDLSLGGASVFLGEKNDERGLRELAGRGSVTDFAEDLKVLKLIGELPSFDPFLLRERLRQHGLVPARCYFEMPPGDVERMRSFVAREIMQLVTLAGVNGGASVFAVSEKLADKLLTDETATALDPLRATLRLTPEEYKEGVFAWKGFLYYKWLATQLLARMPELIKTIETAPVELGTQSHLAAQLTSLRRDVAQSLLQCARFVEQSLLEYGVAFAGLTTGNAGEFRAFLLRAPGLFIPIGQAIGVLNHIESFWAYRVSQALAETWDETDLLELCSEFSVALQGVHILAAAKQRVAQKAATRTTPIFHHIR